MKRILLLLSLAAGALAQVQTIPNTNFPAVRTLLNSNFSWLNTNKASTSATLTLNGVTITLGASNSITTTNITEGTNLYFTNARTLSAMAGLYEAPLTFNSSHFTRTTNTISLKDCANDGYVWKWRTSGGWGCEADQTGEAGGGITTLNTLTGATQTFSRTNDTNVTLTLTPSGTDHNFALGWSGQLGISRGGTGAASTSQNFAFIGPASGSGAPSFRALVAGDIPTLNQSTTGNAATATALAANGANCSAGQIPLGVTATGAAEGCYTPAISTLSDGTSVVTLTGSQTLTNKTLTVPIVGSYTVATLPAATTAGQIAIVTDAATAGNCGTGSGSSLALCRASGSVWVALGDGGSGHTQNTDTGTTQTTFQIDSGNSGPRLKHNAGVLEARNAADDDYAAISALSLRTGVGGSVGGHIAMGQGTPTSAATGEVGFMAPATVTTPFMMTTPGAPTTGFLLNTGTTDPTTISFVAFTGSGDVVRATSSSTQVNSQTCALGSTCTVTADPTSAKFKTQRVVGYVTSGTGAAGVLTDADITLVGATVNDGNAKTLVEASCISDTGDQSVTVKIGSTTLFSIHCVVKGSYSRSTTDGTTGYIVAASMGSTAVAAGDILDASGTANGSTTVVALHAYGTVN